MNSRSIESSYNSQTSDSSIRFTLSYQEENSEKPLVIPLSFSPNSQMADVCEQLTAFVGLSPSELIFENLIFDSQKEMLISLDLPDTLYVRPKTPEELERNSIPNNNNSTPINHNLNNDKPQNSLDIPIELNNNDYIKNNLDELPPLWEEDISNPSEALNLKTETEVLSFLDSLSFSGFENILKDLLGENSPNVFKGTIREASTVSKKQCIPLLIYFHFPEHPDNTTFITEILGFPSIVPFLNHNFLLTSAHVHSSTQSLVKSAFHISKFPFFLIFGDLGNGLSLLTSQQGLTNPELVLEKLLDIQENYGERLENLKKKRAPTEKQLLLEEQNLAFQETLEKDKERERKRREEEEREENEKKKLEHILEHKKQIVENIKMKLPEEPRASQDNVTTLRITLLDGKKVQRRFNNSDPLKNVFAFVSTNIPITTSETPNLQLVTNFPKQTFTLFKNGESTLEQLDLSPQSTLFVETVD